MLQRDLYWDQDKIGFHNILWGACMAGGHVWWGSCVAGGCAWHAPPGRYYELELSLLMLYMFHFQVGGIHGRGHALQGACMVGGMCDRWGVGVCVWWGHAWQGGMCGGGHVWQGGVHGMPPPPRQILRDTVNERAVRILLECILILKLFLILGCVCVCVHVECMCVPTFFAHQSLY